MNKHLSSSAFKEGQPIPAQFTCEGKDRYYFTLYALDAGLTLKPGATRQELFLSHGCPEQSAH
jgi:phosphatidylethanolamine-binding protein (PEBP) family uncharacterized protein